MLEIGAFLDRESFAFRIVNGPGLAVARLGCVMIAKEPPNLPRALTPMPLAAR
jgi:hypothetical protein